MASVLRVHGFYDGVVRDAYLPSSIFYCCCCGGGGGGGSTEEPGTARSRNREMTPRSSSDTSTEETFSCLPFCPSVSLSVAALPSDARERRGWKAIPPEEYMTSPDGLKYYDLIEGNGPVAEKGATAQVHFDCMYRGITAVSSRESKLLAGNRIIAQMVQTHGSHRVLLIVFTQDDEVSTVTARDEVFSVLKESVTPNKTVNGTELKS